MSFGKDRVFQWNKKDASCSAPCSNPGFTARRLRTRVKYEGSWAIDENLLDAANLRKNKQIDIRNVNNGERFTTYAIKGERGSGMVSLNASATRRAQPGDLVTIRVKYTRVPNSMFGGTSN